MSSFFSPHSHFLLSSTLLSNSSLPVILSWSIYFRVLSKHPGCSIMWTKNYECTLFAWTLNSVGPNFSYLCVCASFRGVCFCRTEHNTSESNTSEWNGVIYWSGNITSVTMNQINESIHLRFSQWIGWTDRLTWDRPSESSEWIVTFEVVIKNQVNQSVHSRFSKRIKGMNWFVWACHKESGELIDSYIIVPNESGKSINSFKIVTMNRMNESIHLRSSQ